MPIKKICECGAKVLPTVYDDVLSYEEQIGKLKIAIAGIIKDIEKIETKLPEIDNKLKQKRDIIDSTTRDDLADAYTAKYNPSTRKVEQSKTVISHFVFPGAIASYDDEGHLHTSDPGPDNDNPDLCVNMGTLVDSLDGKRDIVPLPTKGTRFYVATTNGQGYAEGSTGAVNKYDVVQRTGNAQIKAPNQLTFPPLDDEYISKAYADAHYGGGIEHYLVHWGMFSNKYSNGAKCFGAFLATAKEEGMDYLISTAPDADFPFGTSVGSITFRIKTGALATAEGYDSPLAIVQQISIQFDPNVKLNDQFPVGLYCKDTYTPTTSTYFYNQAAWNAWYNSLGTGSPNEVGYWLEKL